MTTMRTRVARSRGLLEPLASRRPPTAMSQRNALHAVHQMLGNQGVQRLLRARANSIPAIQRQKTGARPILKPRDLLEKYRWDMTFYKRFDRIADDLLAAVLSQPSPYRYVIEVFEAIDSSEEDQVGAAFVKRLLESKLDEFAGDYEGRFALTLMYRAIITGSVTEFERKQANRIIRAKLRRIGPEAYVRMARSRGQGRPTPIFPVRFMRVTPGYDYATPLARFMPNGRILVTYPVQSKAMKFRQELRTLGDVFGAGMELNPNEIVGIKNYETSENPDVQYLPALALIDYSNQAIQSTTGKIIEVSAFAATMGFGGAAVVGGRAAAGELVTSTAIWGARLARTASILDRAATVIGIASFVISENREWIVRKLGWPGRRLVQLSDIANNAAAIYGILRLGQAGYGLVRDMRAASKAAREEARALTQAEAATLQRLDDETDLMLKQLDEEAAKSGAAVDDLRATAKTLEIPVGRLEREIDDLRHQTRNPHNIRQRVEPMDAEMSTHGHVFERSKSKRTWCRHSDDQHCNLNLGAGLNRDVDSALSKQSPRRAAYSEGELHEIAGQPDITYRRGSSPPADKPGATPTPSREAEQRLYEHVEERGAAISESFERAQSGAKRHPGLRRDDPRWSKKVARMEENAAFGRLSEDYLRTALQRQLATEFDDVADQVRIRPNLANGEPADFYFIADHLARTPQTGITVAIEGKLSASATLTAHQQAGYKLLAKYGGRVISRNKRNYPHGTNLKATPAMRAEPTIDLKTTPRPQGQDVDFNLVPIQ